MAEVKVGQKYVLLHGGYEGHIVEVIHVSDHWVLYKPGLEEPTGEWTTDSFLDSWLLLEEEDSEPDMVNHPTHYTSDPSGVECIQITRHRNFNIGNAIKYLWRQGLKQDADKSAHAKQIEDLKKAIFYIQDEIKRLES